MGITVVIKILALNITEGHYSSSLRYLGGFWEVKIDFDRGIYMHRNGIPMHNSLIHSSNQWTARTNERALQKTVVRRAKRKFAYKTFTSLWSRGCCRLLLNVLF